MSGTQERRARERPPTDQLHPVSARDLQVLGFLIRNGETSTREMAKLVKAGDDTASRCLTSLFSRGYVTRKQNEADLRMVLFQVTERGRDLYRLSLLPKKAR